MISRKQRELTDNNIAIIADIYQKWRNKDQFAEYKDIVGLCKAAKIQDIRKNNYNLIPGRHIDFKEIEKDGQSFDKKMQNLTSTLYGQMEKGNELDEAIKINLTKFGYTI